MGGLRRCLGTWIDCGRTAISASDVLLPDPVKAARQTNWHQRSRAAPTAELPDAGACAGRVLYVPHDRREYRSRPRPLSCRKHVHATACSDQGAQLVLQRGMQRRSESTGSEPRAPRVGHAVVSRTRVVESVVTAMPSWLRFQDQVMVLPSAETFRRPCPNDPSLHMNIFCVSAMLRRKRFCEKL